MQVYIYQYLENIIVNSTVQDGMTALHLAAIGGHTSGVQLLIEARADLNLKDKVPYIVKWTCNLL